MTHRHRIITALAALLTASTAAAEDEPNLGDLQSLLSEPIISTTSSQTLSTASESPGTVTVITSTDLRRFGMFTIADAINYLCLGMSTANTIAGATIGARGVVIQNDNLNHVLILINGRPESTAIRFPGGMPLELVDHLEVTLGPGSVLYGTGAMLGLINIVLKRAKDFHGIRVGVESGLATTIRPWAGVGYEFKLFGIDSEVSAQVEYFKKWGPSIKYGTEEISVSNSNSLSRYTTSPNGTGIWGGVDDQNDYQSGTGVVQFRVGNTEVLGRAVLTGGANEGYPNDFGNPGNRINKQTYSIGARHRITVSSIVQLTARLYGIFGAQQAQSYRTAPYPPPIGYRVNTQQETNYGDMDIEAFFDWLKDGRLVTLLGFEGRYDKAAVQGNVTTLDIGSTIVSVGTARYGGTLSDDRWTGSPYAQQIWKITKWLSINAGFRVDATNQFPVALSPRVAISANPWRDGTIKLSYARAFRAPTLIEKNQSGDTLSGGILSPLSMEQVSGFEASLEQKAAAHRLLIGAFQSTWSDLIQSGQSQNYVTPSGAYQTVTGATVNLNSISNVGFQGSVHGSFLNGKLSYVVNVTGAIARLSNPMASAVPLSEAPRIYGNVRVAYELPTDWPTVALAAYFSGQRPADNAFAGGQLPGSPGFSPTPYAPPQLSLRATLTGNLPKLTGLAYRGAIDYAFQTYEPYVVGPGTLAQEGLTAPLLLPVSHVQGTVGLQYTF